MKKTVSGIVLLSMMLGLLMLFPLMAGFIGKDTRSVEVNIATITPPFLKDEHAQAVLLYFGYVGCTAVCAPTLNEIVPIYNQLHAKVPSLSFYFVNLNPAQPSNWVEPFAKSFHPDFHGVYTSAAEIKQLERNFNLAVVSNNQEIGHSSNLYLMIKENGHYTNRRIYTTHPYDEKQIEHDVKRLSR